MSVIPMKKLTLIGMKSEEDSILSTFAKMKCVHLDKMQTLDLTTKEFDSEKISVLASKMTAVDDALMYIVDCCNKTVSSVDSTKKHKAKLGNTLIDVSFESLADTERDEFKLFGGVIDNVLKIKNEIVACENEIIKLKAIKTQLLPYMNIDVPFSEIEDTEYTSMLLGALNFFTEKDLAVLIEKYPYAEFVCEFLPQSSVIFAVCMKEDKGDLLTDFNKYGFQKCSFDYGMTPSDKCSEISLQLNELSKKIEELILKIREYKGYIPRLKVLFDFYSYTYQKASADSDLTFTGKTFQVKCWIPKEDEKKVFAELEKVTENIVVYTEDPVRDELPPTKLKNTAFVKPFVSITDMYSVTNYWERDNNKWVAVFYFLFFGFMLGDVGYGIVLSLCAFLAVKLMKPQGGMKNLILIIALGGISTIFWGVIFGGWFSIQEGVPKAIINPLTQPLQMIGLSLALGVIHLTVGLILGGIGLITDGNVLDAIFDKFSWATLFIGAMLYVSGILLTIEVLSTIGLYMVIAMLALILFTAGRHKKGFGKVIGGFGGLYNIINYLSDILSYLRLFGLGLATGVIGMVFNQLGSLMLDGILMPLGIIVLIFGHTLNIAINTLGTYVHDMRLQHIEFFGKYFVGDGIPFTPFAGETKYVNVVDKKQTEAK